MSEKPLVPIQLPSAEVQAPPPSPERGEKIDPRTGRVIAALPATLVVCPVVYEDEAANARHDPECECRGTGLVPLRRPAGDALDPVDDSLRALESAINATADDQDVGDGTYLGDSITNLMHRDVVVTGGGSSGRVKKSRKSASMGTEAPPKTAEDGRLERTGRPPRYHKPRPDRVTTNIAPATHQAIVAKKMDVSEVAETVLASPEFQAELAKIKAEKGVLESE